MLLRMTYDITYLPYEGAAARAGVTTITIGRWVKRGLLTAHVDRLDGRRRLIDRAELEDLLAIHAPAA